jgi:hypothetical protein
MTNDVREGKDELMAAALAAGATRAAAAEVGDVSERTVRRRLNDPEFAARVRELRAEAIAAGLDKLAEVLTRAVDTLVHLMDKSENDFVRLAAAKAIIENLLRLNEHSDHGAQIAELKARLDERDGGRV